VLGLFSYKLTHDTGFAPNPFFGILTLATCKPCIRKSKEEGDWIAGFTSQQLCGDLAGEEKLVYLMEVNEKIPFSRYFLDPDINPGSLVRRTAWRPLLGQVKAAQGHLRNHGIGHGDIFLFFGLFRPVTFRGSQLRFDADALPKHVIWGWLQIDTALAVDGYRGSELTWASYHPHFHREPDRTNTVYVAQEYLSIPGRTESNVRGAGVFEHYSQALQLTKPGSKKTATWQLPQWFHPDGERPPLTYHGNPRRWKRENGHVLLDTVGRGQEFILDCSCYPEAVGWMNHLLDCATVAR
jgi:hypothetical protein